MKIVNLSKAEHIPASGDLFIGTVDRQAYVGEGDSALIRVNAVTFHDGAVNKFHAHTFDQVLLVTAGDGIVQVEGQPEKRVSVGDLIFVPAGERHWHGAAPGKSMTHLTISTPGKTEM
ncbi:MAG TPA: cupin domain-containing protein [Chloroflexota bacterium]|nr:cupin domain-containing protein [Chloroflexota bacterium]